MSKKTDTKSKTATPSPAIVEDAAALLPTADPAAAAEAGSESAPLVVTRGMHMLANGKLRKRPHIVRSAWENRPDSIVRFDPVTYTLFTKAILWDMEGQDGWIFVEALAGISEDQDGEGHLMVLCSSEDGITQTMSDGSTKLVHRFVCPLSALTPDEEWSRAADGTPQLGHIPCGAGERFAAQEDKTRRQVERTEKRQKRLEKAAQPEVTAEPLVMVETGAEEEGLPVMRLEYRPAAGRLLSAPIREALGSIGGTADTAKLAKAKAAALAGDLDALNALAS